MKRGILVSFLLLWCLLTGALPAYANNPPAPDGMLSLILIFPVVILGFRLAGAELTDEEKQKKWRITNGIILGFATLCAMTGTGISAAGLLVLLGYGVLRAVQVMRRGQGGKRFAIGAAVILFTLFASLNYLVSISGVPTARSTEYGAVSAVRTIVNAETQFRSDAKLDANKNGVPEYGALDQLHRARLIPDTYLMPNPLGGYRYAVVLTGDPTRDEKEFFVYATPTHYGEPRIIGISLVNALRSAHRYARRTFASDETGVIRQADLGGSRAVTRDEAQKWEPIG